MLDFALKAGVMQLLCNRLVIIQTVKSCKYFSFSAA